MHFPHLIPKTTVPLTIRIKPQPLVQNLEALSRPKYCTDLVESSPTQDQNNLRRQKSGIYMGY